MGSLIPLVVAAALGVGSIPVWDAVMRFPDSSYWPGVGRQRTANMLATIRSDVGRQMRTAGPGPQQLAARYQGGQLTRDEKVAVLLAAADFHHPCLLPVYAAALRSADLRERQAALVGLHWLLGELAPDATAIPADSPLWERAAGVAEALVAAARERTLVQLWVDSYLAAVDRAPAGRWVLAREPRHCLDAIREIATPADLDALVALWPLLVEQPHRYHVMGTIEMVSLQKFVEIAKSPRGGWGSMYYDASARRVDDWVGSRCGTVDGESLVRWKVRDAATRQELGEVGGWLALLGAGYPPVWPTVADALVAFGAPAMSWNRQRPDDPQNDGAVREVREYFPLTVERLSGAVADRPREPVR
jgi:hypothetical protein